MCRIAYFRPKDCSTKLLNIEIHLNKGIYNKIIREQDTDISQNQ